MSASVGRRLVARAVDLVLLLLILYLVSRAVPSDRLLGQLVLSLVGLTAFEAVFVTQLGATPGKLATGIRIAEPDRTEIDPVTAWTRGAVTAVASLAVLLVPRAIGVMSDSGAGFLLGAVVIGIAGGSVLTILTAPLNRSLADRSAGTLVVPHEAVDPIPGWLVEDAEGTRQRTTPWGPVAPAEARRRARASRLDGEPVLVVVLVAVMVAWVLGRPWVAVALAVLWAVLHVVAEAVAVGRDGGNSGHRREGLAVLDEATGETPGRVAAIARAVTLTVFWLFPPLLPVLMIWVRLSPTGRGPHDLVAGTVVVDTTKVV